MGPDAAVPSVTTSGVHADSSLATRYLTVWGPIGANKARMGLLDLPVWQIINLARLDTIACAVMLPLCIQ